MKHLNEDLLRSFKESFPCAYFGDERMSVIEYLYATEDCSERFHEYLAEGYRRIGSIFYRNICEECIDCKPLRLETELFSPSRSQSRTLKKSRDIRIEVQTPAIITGEKIDLYRRYLDSKHSGREYKEPRDYETVLSNIHYGYARTIEMDYYVGDTLVGVGIVDEAEDALSSNYFYYDTDYLERRPGVLSILKEILLARVMGKKYYYLGFYLEGTAKMAYKKFFRPNQIYEGRQWREFLTK
ncbi:MAG: arginyltransferase [Nitrospirota bacterium]|nr:arginyltransferase [Nitrospirota bacterium]